MTLLYGCNSRITTAQKMKKSLKLDFLCGVPCTNNIENPLQNDLIYQIDPINTVLQPFSLDSMTQLLLVNKGTLSLVLRDIT